jgi:L-alanine-DL-glutamate epimerase-like enolase superfamily enzyme
MKIQDVEVIKLRFEYAPGAGYQTKRGRTTGGLAAIVQITTTEGLRGIGPAYTHPDLLEIIVEQHLSPFLVGHETEPLDEIWSKLYRLTQWYGRKGVAVSAVGAIDTALWDIRGKVEGQPVWRLLGGTSPRVPAYGSGLLWEPEPSALVVRADELRRRGFVRLKTRTGVNLDYDCAVVEAVLTGLGSDGQIMVDGSHRYSLRDALTFADFLASRGVVWFEEPFSPGDIDSYISLREATTVPIAAGENEFGVEGFRELFRSGAIDIAQPDASRAGGITECVRIATLAQKHDLLVAPHTWSDAVTVITNAHIVASSANGMTVEVNQAGNPLIDDLIDPPLTIHDGHLVLSDTPGLGIELNADALQRYRVPKEQHVLNGHYSDMTFGSDWEWMWPAYPVPDLPKHPLRGWD